MGYDVRSSLTSSSLASWMGHGHVGASPKRVGKLKMYNNDDKM